jgi:hypothetical protein
MNCYHVAGLKLIGGGVSGGRVDGGAASPQRVEPRHEGGVVLKTVSFFSRKKNQNLVFSDPCLAR